jgi:hypothetical protein
MHENTQGPLVDAPKVTTNQMNHTLQNSLHQPNAFLSSQNPDKSQFYSTAKSIQG